MLADPRLISATERLGRPLVKAAAVEALDQVRNGLVAPEAAADLAVSLLPRSVASLRPVLNCTGVVLHTNLGRAPLSPAALAAVVQAGGYTDVELDLATGERSTRGQGALAALRELVPEAGDVLVVNNGAAALLLAVAVLGGEVLVSRGELVEIGDGFRLTDLISCGAKIKEVGTTNRTHLSDYAVDERTGCILKVHPSNFTMSGFTSSVEVSALSGLGVPVVADVGSGLLSPDPLLPDEPDVRSALLAGAGLVTCSGDKLLGGPQSGLVFGTADLVLRLRRHPLYRAVRCDKLTLAALEATLRGPVPPVWQAIRASGLEARCRAVAEQVGAEVVPSDGTVGGGGAPGVVLPGWAVALDASLAGRLRTGDPAVVGRVHQGRLLIDLRCVPPADDFLVIEAVLACTS